MANRKLASITFYDVDGKRFSDEIAQRDTVKETEYVAANLEGKSYAKEESYDRGVRYFVKRCTYGSNNGSLANPYAMLARTDEFSAFNAHSGRPYYEYTQVSDIVFNSYLRFLRTRNSTHLRLAERELFANGSSQRSYRG